MDMRSLELCREALRQDEKLLGHVPLDLREECSMSVAE